MLRSEFLALQALPLGRSSPAQMSRLHAVAEALDDVWEAPSSQFGNREEEEGEEEASLDFLHGSRRPLLGIWTVFYEPLSWHVMFGVCVLPVEYENYWLSWASTSVFASIFCALLGSTVVASACVSHGGC